MARECIEIPTADSSEVVEVFLDEIQSAEEATGVCELIASEEAPPSLYLRLAHSSPQILTWITERAIVDCKLRAPAVAAELLGMRAMSILKGEGDTDNNATMLLNQAERLDGMATSLWARKGLLLLLSSGGNNAAVEAGELQFKAILDKEKDSLVARAGLGLAAFKRADYKSAASHFDQLRRVNCMSRDAMMAYGSACAASGDVKEAVNAFKECLKLSQKDFEAIKCLGITLVCGLEVLGHSAVHEGLQCLKQYFTEHNKEDAFVCLMLADHFFYKKDYAKAQTLATTALSTSSNDVVRAKAVYMQAKCCHAQGMLDEAFARYLQVVKLNSQHAAGLYGLAQLYVVRNDLGSAIKCLSSLLDTMEVGGEQVYALMGCLCVQRYSETGDVDLLDRGSNALSKLNNINVLPNVVKYALASVLENKDPGKAISIYEQLAIEDRDTLVQSPERLANIALLFLNCGRLDKANEYLSLIGDALDDDDNFKFLKALILSSSSSSSSETVFKEINSRPALLHLAHQYIHKNKFQEATEMFKEMLGADEQDCEAWFGLAVCHLRQRAFTPARKSFERILANIDKHDIPCLCGLAVVYIELARRDPEHASSIYRRSLEFAGKALSLDPQCHVAANAAGVALAELGMLSQARDAFQSLCELKKSNLLLSTRMMADIMNNAGNAMVEAGQFEEAQLSYQLAIESATEGNRKAQYCLLYARAAYAAGKHSSDVRHFYLAVERLNNMTDCDPELSFMAMYNRALCKQEAALALMKASAAMTPAIAIGRFEEAIRNICESITEFSNIPSNSQEIVDAKMVQQRLSYSQSLRGMLEKKLEEARTKESLRLSQLQQLQLERSKAEEKARQQAELEAKRKSQEIALIEEQRRKLTEQVKIVASDTEEPNDRAKERKQKRAKKRKSETFEEKSPEKKSYLSKDFISSSEKEEDEEEDDDEKHPNSDDSNNNNNHDDDDDELDRLFN